MNLNDANMESNNRVEWGIRAYKGTIRNRL